MLYGITEESSGSSLIETTGKTRELFLPVRYSSRADDRHLCGDVKRSFPPPKFFLSVFGVMGKSLLSFFKF